LVARSARMIRFDDGQECVRVLGLFPWSSGLRANTDAALASILVLGPPSQPSLPISVLAVLLNGIDESDQLDLAL